MSPEEFSAVFKRSPMNRAKLRGLKRNAAVVLRNGGDERGISTLICTPNDLEPLVREHAEWALACVGASEALEVPRGECRSSWPGCARPDELRSALNHFQRLVHLEFEVY